MLSCLTNTVLHRYLLLLPPFMLIPEPCKNEWDIDVPFRPGYSTVSYFLSVDQLSVFVFVNNNLLQKEAFMMRFERYAYLWVKDKTLWGIYYYVHLGE